MSGATTAPRVPRRTGSGFGRLLVAVYGVLALAALARSAYQITQRFSEAPLPYSLSALAAVVYAVATVALARGTRPWRAVAWGAVVVEAVGVLAVGTDSLLQPQAYPDATVWSVYGQGYGFVPLVLPFVGIWWLWRTRSGGEPGTESEAS
ncbi:hypothetical protein [Isoptericola variabilis]|uniref:Integral membrane protein n=1 Tax=Isoptericola variabilis (strain 225) TaxID=743718 RepID=F6FWZ3_ISOV2|nr:hypothetical protein Isova_1847 [Isoptericola variabilis 225]